MENISKMMRHFIQLNYSRYDGDESFLMPPTEKTKKLWSKLQQLQKEEKKKGGILNMDTDVVSTITSHSPGYLDKDNEVIVGLQTNEPLKRAFMPFGGIRMAEQACTTNGYVPDGEFHRIFTEYHTTHSDAVFSMYNDEIKKCRHNHIITGLPDTYGRGRIIGDYRRIAFCGIDNLIQFKRADIKEIQDALCLYDNVDSQLKKLDELAQQIKALKDMAIMASSYGYDITRPARNAKEAVQWLYFGYLAAIKSQNGAAMSVGRISTFLDIYIEKDIQAGKLTESEAQELIDQLVLKLRMVRFARIPAYNELFSGDPVWATLEVAGMLTNKQHMVTKTDFRFLHTLENMGPSPEPNLTVLWSEKLPENFKKYATKISIATSSIQYENDDLMRDFWGNDYSICCCVSAAPTGAFIQYFGARANLAKCLLYAINGGIDEKTFEQVGFEMMPLEQAVLDYTVVTRRYQKYLEWLAKVYIQALNIIHYCHDKYYYESAEMALIDTDYRTVLATGIAGLSHVVDSLSAIKYATVMPIRNEQNIAIDFKVIGDFPKYGNDDDRADDIANWVIQTFTNYLRQYTTYKNVEVTTSLLTITSNVVYGKATGATPDGRKAWTPFAPGANPSYGAETNGLLASLNSVAKMPYALALDGISNTQTISPDALGHNDEERVNNLIAVLDGYFIQGGQHLNVNVFGTEKLIDAMEHPEKEEYANFTIRVSGYAVKFINLTKEQQLDVIQRTCHKAM
jgi:formate C-acetyltransferase